jgi:hypothetical protein
MQVLSSHITLPNTPTMTSNGGLTPSTPKNFLVKSLVCAMSQISARSWMLAQESELQSSSQVTGGHGGLFQVRKMKEGTSDGLKQSGSSSLSILSSKLVSLANSLGSSVTIGALLKDGRKVEVATGKQTLSSGEFTTSSLLADALLLHDMLQARKTQQMPPHEASTLLVLSSSLLGFHQVALQFRSE